MILKTSFITLSFLVGLTSFSQTLLAASDDIEQEKIKDSKHAKALQVITDEGSFAFHSTTTVMFDPEKVQDNGLFKYVHGLLEKEWKKETTNEYWNNVALHPISFENIIWIKFYDDKENSFSFDNNASFKKIKEVFQKNNIVKFEIGERESACLIL